MFNPSKSEVRNFFSDTWAKHLTNEALGPLEQITLNILQHHPEYLRFLSATPEEMSEPSGLENPFLHLSLHLAVEEQLQINQPPGIVSLYQTLCKIEHDEHRARHQIMECLAEVLWTTQQEGRSLNPDDYQIALQQLQHKITNRATK